MIDQTLLTGEEMGEVERTFNFYMHKYNDLYDSSI